MQQMSSRLALVSVALFGVYIFLYPGSIILVALDRVPVWATWMGGALLIIQGTLMGVWLSINYARWGVVASALIVFLAWLVEHIGATTGFPFGTYTYTDVLQPKIFGVVPLAIPCAWLLIVGAAVGTSERVLEQAGRSPDSRVSVTKVLTAASLALLLDVTIEPFAVNINHYWVWSDSGHSTYYGIPTSNFAAWWVTSVILVLVLLNRRRAAAIARRHQRPRPQAHTFWPWLPLTLYLTNLTMFVLVNMARGQGMAAAIGGLILLFLGWRLLPHAVRILRGRIGEGVGGA
ncbi:carotenoid biosynthesis protein [Oscillochloris sp. ZM17-4]|uniref:carotenoid biosynthesis protein n=1 Tax=Oscillochloris sp. ZM17-4 TaxID=2866714 RepID=UPI001C7322BD|nr:carotenoid biosynthesis protein [Oscillochloris sp. ZM17-4]MBX0328888.1 carotenoid biosynthesis protein [Oscillochloris sp. ZM17-4]